MLNGNKRFLQAAGVMTQACVAYGVCLSFRLGRAAGAAGAVFPGEGFAFYEAALTEGSGAVWFIMLSVTFGHLKLTEIVIVQ